MKDGENGKDMKESRDIKRIFLNIPVFSRGLQMPPNAHSRVWEVRGDLASLGTASVANAM